MKIHVVLTKQDADIAAFKKSLPQGQWSKHVVQIMTAALRDRVADIPMDFQIEPLDKNLHTKISLPEKQRSDSVKNSGTKKAASPPASKQRSASASGRICTSKQQSDFRQQNWLVLLASSIAVLTKKARLWTASVKSTNRYTKNTVAHSGRCAKNYPTK